MTRQPATPGTSLTIDEISPADHEAFLARQPSVSFLQNPNWARIKTDWAGRSIGWFRGEEIVGAGFVLHRHVPVPLLKGKNLAYLADGPVFDRGQVSLRELLGPLVPFLRGRGAFLVRMGLPVVHRSWEAATVRRAIANGEGGLIPDLEPAHVDPSAQGDISVLEELGWQRPEASEDFPAGQPQFQARVPLTPLPEAEHDPEGESFHTAVDAALGRMDATSRRQTRKSTRSELTVTRGGEEALAEWHRLYEETAQRDDFSGRPLAYFQRMFAELNASGLSSCEVLLAHWEQELLAASIYVQQGDFGWYVYGASATAERKRYAPRLLQLEQVKLTLGAGARWYDLGGVSPTLNSAHPLAGLTRFKTTMGADVVETLGEWDYPINPLLAKAFNLYLARR